MTKTTDTPVIAFKGFDANFQCRSYQYEVGGTYTHDGAVEMCKTGFHACENPLDVWNYYGPCDGNRFAVVELSGSIERKDGEDSKLCAASLHVKAELKLPEFVNSAATWLIDHCKSEKDGEKVQSASGDSAKLAASGYSAKLAASGKDSVIASSAYRATAKGAEGTWIALAEFDDNGKCVGFATGCAGKDGVPAAKWIKAQGGKLVEVEA